jgi:hypothetical protein
MLLTPVPTSPDVSLPLDVGSIWLRYRCTLKRAEVQESFVGGCDVYTAPLNPGDTINDIPSLAWVSEPTQNTGTIFNPADPQMLGTDGSWYLPPGAWVCSLYIPGVIHTLDAGTGSLTVPVLAGNGLVPYIAIDDTNSVPIGSFQTGGSTNSLAIGAWFMTHGIASGAQSAIDVNTSFKVVIPDDGSRYRIAWDWAQFPNFANASASITSIGQPSSATVTLARVFPSPTDVALLAQRSDSFRQLLQRVRRMELKVNTANLGELTWDEESESKEEKTILSARRPAPPSATPRRGAAAAAAATPTSSPSVTPSAMTRLFGAPNK